MTTQKVIVIASIIIGIAIVGYGYMDYAYKMKTLDARTKQEQQAETQKIINEAVELEKIKKLEDCQQNVRARFSNTDIKITSNEEAALVLKLHRDELDNCIQMYK